MQFFSSVGPFFQSFSEARGAATQVFQHIDEVCINVRVYLYLILTIIFSIYFHDIGTRNKYK